MNKMEFEIEKLKIMERIQTRRMWTDIAIGAITAVTVAFCLWAFVNALADMASHNPQALEAISHIVDNFGLSQITAYIVGLAGIATGVYERRGKKRAIEKLATYQEQEEADDPYRGSSQLTRRGDTPRKKRSN